MTLEEWDKKIGAIEAALKGDLTDTLRRAGGDLCALIADRIINTGKDSQGDFFTPYSQTKVPAYFYFNRSRSGGADARVRAAAKKREGLSYSDFRRLNNLPTDKKNFSFTNDMWRHFGVKKINKSPNGWKMTIGGLTTLAQNKIEWLSGQENQDIVQPTKQEVECVKDAVLKFILK